MKGFTWTDTRKVESVDYIGVLGGLFGATRLGLCTLDNVCGMSHRILRVGTLSRSMRHLRDSGYSVELSDET